MTKKRDQRLVQSESAIIEAGMRTFLENPRAGMSSVAAAAGVGRTTLYRHFDSREALLKAIALKCLDEVDRVLLPVYQLRGRQAIESTLELLVPVANRYRFLSRLWQEIEDDSQLMARSRQYADDMLWLFDQAREDGDIDTQLPPEWLNAFFDTTLYAAWEVLEAETLSADEAARLAIRSFFKGVGPS